MERTGKLLKTGKTLSERLRGARDKYYRDIATVIANNPEKSYQALMAEHGLTSWAIKRAVKIGGISRPCGRGSPAYGKNKPLGHAQ